MGQISLERRIVFVSILILVLLWLAGMGYLYAELSHEVEELVPHLFPGEESDEHAREILEVLSGAVFYPLLAGLPILALSLFVVVYVSFGPVRELKETVERLNLDHLEPLPTERIPVELVPLVESLNKLFERTKAMWERERRLTADAAHELRTPLAVIQVNAQALSASVGGDASRSQLVSDLLVGCERASHAVDQMLELARLESQQSGEIKPEVDVSELLRLELALLMPLAQARSIDLDVEVPDTTPASLRGEVLSIAVRNLVSNAIKYAPCGGSVRVSLCRNHEKLQIEVSDSGAGMESRDAKRLGERFFRAHNDVTGTGLGWAIIRECLRILGARVDITGQGPLGGLTVLIVVEAEKL